MGSHHQAGVKHKIRLLWKITVAVYLKNQRLVETNSQQAVLDRKDNRASNVRKREMMKIRAKGKEILEIEESNKIKGKEGKIT